MSFEAFSCKKSWRAVGILPSLLEDLPADMSLQHVVDDAVAVIVAKFESQSTAWQEAATIALLGAEQLMAKAAMVSVEPAPLGWSDVWDACKGKMSHHILQWLLTGIVAVKSLLFMSAIMHRAF